MNPEKLSPQNTDLIMYQTEDGVTRNMTGACVGFAGYRRYFSTKAKRNNL